MNNDNGTYIRPRYPLVYFDGITAKSSEGIEQTRRDCYDKIAEVRERLAMLIASTPKEMMTKAEQEDSTVQGWITENLDDIESELREVMGKLGELDVYENIIWDWENEFRYSNTWEDIWGIDDMSDNEARKIAFPEQIDENAKDKADYMLRGKHPNEKTVDEFLAKYMKNIISKKHYSDKIRNLVFATYDGQLFTTYTGQWLFKSKEEAIDAIKDEMSIPTLEYTGKKFTEANPELFDDLSGYLDTEEGERMKELAREAHDVMSSSFSEFYGLFTKAVDNLISHKFKFTTLDQHLHY